MSKQEESPATRTIRAMTFLLVQYAAIMRSIGIQGKDENVDLLIDLTGEAIADARRYLGDDQVDEMLKKAGLGVRR